MPCSCENRRQDRDGAPILAREGRRLTVTARAAGVPLVYPRPDGSVSTEHAIAGDLGDLAIGAPIELEHGGPIVGRVVEVRRTDAALVAVIDLDPEGEYLHAALAMPHVSADYTVGRLDADGGQRGVKIRAIALVPRGRCGDSCAVRKDHPGPCYDLPDPMAKIKIAGKEYEAGSSEAAAAATAEATRLDALGKALRADASKALRAQVSRAFPALEIRKDADDQSIMVETINKIAPQVDLSNASPDFIAGAFAVAIAMALDVAAKAEGPDEPPAPPDESPPPPAQDGGAPRADGAASVRAGVFTARAAATEPKRPVYQPSPDQVARQRMIERANKITPAKR